MSGKTAKMLRRLLRASSKDKKIFNTMTTDQKGEIRADYIERGEDRREKYTAAKKQVKMERADKPSRIGEGLEYATIDAYLVDSHIPIFIPTLAMLYQRRNIIESFKRAFKR